METSGDQLNFLYKCSLKITCVWQKAPLCQRGLAVGTLCLSALSTGHTKDGDGQSAATIFAHWSADHGNLVDVWIVLQLLDNRSIVFSRSDSMHDINACMTVGQAAVAV